MYAAPELAFKFLHYYCTASNGKGHGTHSPFIFHFIKRLLNNKQHFPEYDIVEGLRKGLLRDMSVVTIEDFGAGSAISKSKERTISSIVRNAAKPKKYGQLLFRLVKEYQPETIIELGTSLGISTSCLSLAKPDAKIITLEGATALAEVARNNFDKLKLKNILLKVGNFDQTLPVVVEGLPSVDFVFIDGNHRKEPTLRYFNLLLSIKNNNSIFVFDDIHWSQEMEQAWGIIKNHPGVRCTIDLFFTGIVFFRKEFLEKQDFTIRF